MALLPPYYNRELFSKHFLEQLLPQQPEWVAAREAAVPVLATLRELYRRIAPSATLKEQQLEQKWIRPVLEALGVVFDVQVPLPTDSRAVTLAPDYALFGDAPAHKAARALHEGGQMARYYLVTDRGERRVTGSFYTPDFIVEYIVDEALAPLVRGRSPAQIKALRVVDPAMGSGHFLLGAIDFLARAYGQARIDAGEDADGILSDDELEEYRRIVAEHCIFGVDVNPMAVELAKLALWLETMARDRPLTFLDHHLRCGNSLPSSLMWWYLWFSAPHKKDEAYALHGFFMETIPLVAAPEEPATALISLAKAQHEAEDLFLNWLRTEMGVAKPSQRLQAFWTLSDADCFAEIKKAKVKLSAAAKKRVAEEHERARGAILPLLAESRRLERELHALVFRLYDLTEDEIALVRRTASPRDPLNLITGTAPLTAER